MLTKKHYKAIAEIIRDNTEKASEWDIMLQIINPTKLIQQLCLYFQADNPRFDKQRFLDACNK